VLEEWIGARYTMGTDRMNAKDYSAMFNGVVTKSSFTHSPNLDGFEVFATRKRASKTPLALDLCWQDNLGQGLT
jgi:hypothetical protein